VRRAARRAASLLRARIGRPHIVVDHHQRVGPVDADYCDLRPHYGATSTILTEYLEAAEADVSQRLATALLYGIKSDTLMLNRETGRPTCGRSCRSIP